jgi:hypothetical protein
MNRLYRINCLVTTRAASVKLAACILVTTTLLLVDLGLAQDNRVQDNRGQENRMQENRMQENRATADAAAPTPPGPGSNAPGFIDTLGRWLEEGATKLKSEMQSAQERMGERMDRLGNQARESTKDATGAVTGLTNTRIVIAREQCVVAANGAADCQAAAVTLCRGKGFATGKSLDTQTEQKCKSGRFLLEGRVPSSADCPTNIFVTRAMCQ